MTKTRILSALLAVVMLFGLIPCGALHAQAAGDTVTFCLIGADKEGDYIVWIPEGEYAISKLSHVGKVLAVAAEAHGLTLTGLENNYISAITAPEALGGYEMAEFTNGQYSGWMYTVNGTHPGRGVNARYLADGDVVVFHYVNDYRYEVEDWSGGSLGTEEDWNRWLDADDSWLKGEEEEELPPAEDKETEEDAPLEDAPNETPPAEDELPEASEDTSSAAAEDVDAAIDALSVSKANSKTRKRLDNIRSAYDALTEEERALVTRYEALEEMEDTFDELLAEAREEAEEDLEKLAEELEDSGTKDQKSDIEDILEEALEDVEAAEDTDEIDDICDDAEEDMKKVLGEEEEETARLTFDDMTAADWFYDDVAFVVEEGLFNGTSDTTFSPDISMTRAMLVTVLYRLEGEPAVDGVDLFSDVEADGWYADAVSWASSNGIVSGYGNDLFGTNDNITREQLAAILYRYAAMQLFDVSTVNDLAAFTDRGTVSSYAMDAVGWANAAGLLNGRTEETLAPLGTATRAEVAAIIHRFAENF